MPSHKSGESPSDRQARYLRSTAFVLGSTMGTTPNQNMITSTSRAYSQSRTYVPDMVCLARSAVVLQTLPAMRHRCHGRSIYICPTSAHVHPRFVCSYIICTWTVALWIDAQSARFAIIECRRPSCRYCCKYQICWNSVDTMPSNAPSQG